MDLVAQWIERPPWAVRRRFKSVLGHVNGTALNYVGPLLSCLGVVVALVGFTVAVSLSTSRRSERKR